MPPRSPSPDRHWQILITNAKNPAAAFRLADLMYNYEATLRNALGRPEQEWVWSEPGAEGIDGGEAKYKVIAIYTESEQNFSWNQAAPRFRFGCFPPCAGIQS